VRRLVIVFADGLRPDAVSPSVMPSLDALGRVYTLARRARTVRPSATVAGRGRPLQDVLDLSYARLREGLDPGGVNVPTVLFLCVANSARSQMAEGLARQLAPPGFRFWSAGSEPGTLHPLAVAALAEQGIDLSHHRAKGLASIPLAQVDTIVTLCADEVCPIVPGNVRRLHWPLPDPASARGSDAERLAAFRNARDTLARLLPTLWSDQLPGSRTASS